MGDLVSIQFHHFHLKVPGESFTYPVYFLHSTDIEMGNIADKTRKDKTTR